MREGGGGYDSAMGKMQFMLVVGGDTVEVIAIVGWVGMEVACREHTEHSQEDLATQWNMPDHFLCTRWEHC